MKQEMMGWWWHQLDNMQHLITHFCRPFYLAETICPVSSHSTRHRLRSAGSSMVLIPSTCRSTLGDRAFPVAAAKAWNSLPDDVRDATSLLTFHCQLKTVLFRQSYSD